LKSNAIVTSRVAQIARDQNRELPLVMFASFSRAQTKSSLLIKKYIDFFSQILEKRSNPKTKDSPHV
jgi:oxalate decarboxylase/phosphoglucose isomerase-like protein (cupin superfamily)